MKYGFEFKRMSWGYRGRFWEEERLEGCTGDVYRGMIEGILDEGRL